MTKRGMRRMLIFFVCLVILLFFSPRVILRLVYPEKYSEEAEACSAAYDVPKEIIYAVIKTESNFDPDAVSSAGAVGLMQIMPSTFLWLTEMTGETLPSSSLNDPEVNIRYGTFFLRYLYEYYGNYETAFAAYNAGMGNVSKWLASEEYAENGMLVRIPFGETDAYVRSVTKNIKLYQKLYK